MYKCRITGGAQCQCYSHALKLMKKGKYIGLKNIEEISFYSWKCGVVLALFYLAEVHVEKHVMIIAIAKEMSFIQLYTTVRNDFATGYLVPPVKVKACKRLVVCCYHCY